MKKIAKQLISLALVAMLTLSAMPFAHAEDIDIDGKAVILIDLNSDRILYEKNKDTALPMASTTKIMTALLVLEKLELDQKVTIIADDIDEVRPYQSPHNLQVGEEFTVEDMMYLMMISSVNEAAVALGRTVSGSVVEFVALMNQRAAQLGATKTHFVNTHGLPVDNHYSSAADLALITKEALKNEFFTEISSYAQKKLPPTNKTPTQRHIYTTNRMILRSTDPEFYKYNYGIKTGFTNPAGHCFVGLSKKGDSKLLTVILGADRDEATKIPKSFTETRRLSEWGFNNFKMQTLLSDGESVSEAPIRLSSERDSVVLAADGSVEAMLPLDFDEKKVTREIRLNENIKAPIAVGDVLGEMEIGYDGESFDVIPLVSLHEASLSSVLYYVDILENFFKTPGFKIFCIMALFLLLLYLLLLMVLRRRKRRNRYRKSMRNSVGTYKGKRQKK